MRHESAREGTEGSEDCGGEAAAGRDGREDPAESDEVGTAKKTTTVRGNDEPQSVRHSQ